MPLISDILMFDDSYLDHKNIGFSYVGKATLPVGVSSTYNYPQSNHAVLNNFRSDFEDFSYFSDIKLSTPSLFLNSISLASEDFTSLKEKNIKFQSDLGSTYASSVCATDASPVEVNPVDLYSTRFSNPIALRRSAKSSLVTYQAYQKVFKLRYEEGRAHVRLSDFADSKTTQPYTTEQKVKYEKMLGKNRIKFYNTSINLTKLLKNFNSNANLSNSLNNYFYEFPFLDGVTNDPTRHVWFDIYSKYAQREVSGSSVSKYTIVGVPFYKKKYDFNVKQGRQLADSELYFTRIATSRKNYLPQ